MNFGRCAKDYPKGSIVECSRCGKPQAKLIKKMQRGDFMRQQHFEWIEHPFAMGEKQICRKCFSTGTVVPLFENGEIVRLSSKEKKC